MYIFDKTKTQISHNYIWEKKNLISIGKIVFESQQSCNSIKQMENTQIKCEENQINLTILFSKVDLPDHLVHKLIMKYKTHNNKYMD